MNSSAKSRLPLRVLLIDNYDSFTYNLAQYLGELGTDLLVFRNDKLSLEDIESLNPARIVISPGPGVPANAGISIQTILKFGSRIPILGVCLGHQAIGEAFGGRVIRAGELMHGKTSMIHHESDTIFTGIPTPFEATRYHSLVVENSSLPECLIINAWTQEGVIMGLRHREYEVFGVQFHPESILTRPGMQVLENFLCCQTPSKS